MTPRKRSNGGSERLWREWCFARVAFAHFRIRFALIVIVLGGGALSFLVLEPGAGRSPLEALYCTWQLVFGQNPEAFPRSRWLQAMFFLVPVLGLTIIIEGIVDFSLMLRDRRRHERSWCIMMASASRNHVVLVGLGRLGYKTYLLLRQLGEQVVVIERAADNQFLEDIRRDGAPLLIGDARREALLSDAHIEQARSIILATTDDLANLEIALDARRANPDVRVVLRMFDQNMADKVRDGFNIHIAMSQAAISAPAFVTAALEPGSLNGMVVGRQVIAMQRWPVQAGDPVCHRTVGDVLGELGCSVVELSPAGRAGGPVIFPAPQTKLKAGDTLLLQGTLETLRRLRRNMER